jgi:hypothetical protein
VAAAALSVDVTAKCAVSEVYACEAVGGGGGDSATVGAIFRILTLILHILTG